MTLASEETERALIAERASTASLRDQVHSLEQTVQEHAQRVEEQQQAISLLVSEKASLSSDVERLERTESGTCHTYVRAVFVTHVLSYHSFERNRRAAGGRICRK